MNNLITEIKRMNSLMGHQEDVLLEFRDKLRKALASTTKKGVVTLTKAGEELSLEISKAIGKSKQEADDIVLKLSKKEKIDPKMMGEINKNFIILGSKYADDAILDFVTNDKTFVSMATKRTEESIRKTLKNNGFDDVVVNKMVDQYKKNGGQFKPKPVTVKDLSPGEKIIYDEKIKAFQQSQAALNKSIKLSPGTRNQLAKEARDEATKLAQQALNKLSSGTKSKILEAFKDLGPKSLKFLENLKIVKKNAVGKYQLTTIGLLTIPIVAGGTIGLVAVIINFMSKGVDPEPEIKTILTQDELKKVEQQDVKKEVIRFEDEAYKKEIKVALGKSPDEAFTDEDINLIYKKFVDNNLIQTK